MLAECGEGRRLLLTQLALELGQPGAKPGYLLLGRGDLAGGLRLDAFVVGDEGID
jgi:hypothetical protein